MLQYNIYNYDNSVFYLKQDDSEKGPVPVSRSNLLSWAQ
jgi:hypothetical protein